MFSLQLRNFKTVNTVKFKANEQKPTYEESKFTVDNRNKLYEIFSAADQAQIALENLAADKEEANLKKTLGALSLARLNKPGKQEPTFEEKLQVYRDDKAAALKKQQEDAKLFCANQQKEKEEFVGDENQLEKFKIKQNTELMKFINGKRMELKNNFHYRGHQLLEDAKRLGIKLTVEDLLQ